MPNNFASGTAKNYLSRSDTFTATGMGVTTSVRPLNRFAIQATGTGAAPTSWTIILEGSLDGVNFTTILTHTNLVGNGVVLWAVVTSPVIYFRSNCTALVLGGATNIISYILGTE